MLKMRGIGQELLNVIGDALRYYLIETALGIALVILAAFLILTTCVGCATKAVQSDDGNTLTLRTGLFGSGSARFANGAQISSKGWKGPDTIGVTVKAPINAPLTLPEGIIDMPVGVNE